MDDKLDNTVQNTDLSFYLRKMDGEAPENETVVSNNDFVSKLKGINHEGNLNETYLTVLSEDSNYTVFLRGPVPVNNYLESDGPVYRVLELYSILKQNPDTRTYINNTQSYIRKFNGIISQIFENGGNVNRNKDLRICLYQIVEDFSLTNTMSGILNLCGDQEFRNEFRTFIKSFEERDAILFLTQGLKSNTLVRVMFMLNFK
jgi:hypothetical protein